MKTWIRASVAAALAAAVGLGATAALAGPEGCDPGMHGMMQPMDPARLTERADRRLDRLEQALAIRPEQRAAWDAFDGVMHGVAQKAAEHMQAMHGQERPATVIERMARMETFGEERLEGMREVRQAAETLYGQLDEVQKKTFDDRFHAFAPGRMRGGHHRHGGQGRGMGQGPGDDV